jgi:GWxTD domain-containing protein
MVRAGVMLLGLVLSGSSLLAQSSRTGGPRQDAQQFLFFEAVNLVSTDSTKSRIDVHYRVDRDFFVPIRNPEPSFPWEFRRRGELLIELIDKHGTSRTRDIRRFDIGSATAEKNIEKKEWYQGIVSFDIEPGEYTVLLEIDDLESERKFIDRNTKVTAKSFRGPKLETGSPLFITGRHEKLPDPLLPQNYGGNVLFGEKTSIYLELPVARDPDIPVSIEYTVSAIETQGEKREPHISGSVSGEAMFPLADLRPNERDGLIEYSIGAARTRVGSAIVIPLETETLSLRRYSLTLRVKIGDRSAEVSKPFMVVWPDMPLSLRNVEYALDMLRYIVTERELDSLKRGSFEEKRRKLEEFWQAKDNTPETAVNELMTEYYRRVDYAARNFSTIQQPDGARTDRGRIFIVYGPPTRLDRSLNPGADFQEVWFYESIGRKFVFADPNKSGNYTLVSSQSL